MIEAGNVKPMRISMTKINRISLIGGLLRKKTFESGYKFAIILLDKSQRYLKIETHQKL